jgi:hypothetical protein
VQNYVLDFLSDNREAGCRLSWNIDKVKQEKWKIMLSLWILVHDRSFSMKAGIKDNLL